MASAPRKGRYIHDRRDVALKLKYPVPGEPKSNHGRWMPIMRATLAPPTITSAARSGAAGAGEWWTRSP